MAGKRITWTEEASADFKATLKFYKERNGNATYSRKLADQIFGAIKLLQKNNYLGKRTSDNEVRVLVKGTFSIFYEVKAEEILILIVWDTRRSPGELTQYLP